MLLACITTLSQQYEAMHLIFERGLSDGLQATAANYSKLMVNEWLVYHH